MCVWIDNNGYICVLTVACVLVLLKSGETNAKFATSQVRFVTNTISELIENAVNEWSHRGAIHTSV